MTEENNDVQSGVNAESETEGVTISTHPGAQAGSSVTNITIQQNSEKNSLGLAGFVLALIAVFLGWVPGLGWILWLAGAILSIVGLFRKPKGLAIAGTIISFIDIILLVTVFSALVGVLSFM
ncbi:MAG: hypothetical protein LBL41_04565 [Bifidobacteriaceae bacterium]|jgi:hypothetical protein|nr:hypothetical protein [Bifidobacteriaceae bacterium]